MNISSVVVKCAPQFLDDVLSALHSVDCEVYAHDPLGRIIVILEGATTEEESEKLKTLQAIPHVLAAEMVYAFSENEFAPEEGKFDKVSENLIINLNQDQDANDIVYHGHLKDKS